MLVAELLPARGPATSAGAPAAGGLAKRPSALPRQPGPLNTRDVTARRGQIRGDARPRAQVDEAAKTLPEQRTRPEKAVAGAIGAFL